MRLPYVPLKNKPFVKTRLCDTIFSRNILIEQGKTMYKALLKPLCLSVALLTTTAMATDNDPLNIITRPHMDMFVNAVENDVDREETIAIFKKYADDNPDNDAVIIYYGSLLAARAQHEWFPLTRLKLANEGLTIIDKMLETVDDDRTTMGVAMNTPAWFESKILSALVFLRLPNVVFQRRHEGMTIAQEVITTDGFDRISPKLKVRILSRYALELSKDNKLDTAKIYAQQALDVIEQANLQDYDNYAEMAKEALNAKPVGG